MNAKRWVYWSFLGALVVAPVRAEAPAKAKKLSDGRQLLEMPEQDKALMLRHMRDSLGFVQTILEQSQKGDWEAVQQAAAPLTTAGIAEGAKGFSVPPPPSFMAMAMPMHTLFDKIRADAKTVRDAGHTAQQVAEVLGTCVACHQAFALNP